MIDKDNYGIIIFYLFIALFFTAFIFTVIQTKNKTRKIKKCVESRFSNFEKNTNYALYLDNHERACFDLIKTENK